MFFILALLIFSCSLFPYVNNPEQTELYHFSAPQTLEEITSKIFTDILRVNTHMCVIGSEKIDFNMCQNEDVHSSVKFGHVIGGMLDVCSAAKSILKYLKLGNATVLLLREMIRELHDVGPYLWPENNFRSSCDLSEEAKIQDYITFGEFCFWIQKFCSKMGGLQIFSVFIMVFFPITPFNYQKFLFLECMRDLVEMRDSKKYERYKYDTWVTKISMGTQRKILGLQWLASRFCM